MRIPSPKTVRIDQPYAVVDAMAGVFLRANPSIQKLLYRRGEISAGSARHYALGTDGHEFLSIYFMALSTTTTLAQCDAGIIITQRATPEEVAAIETSMIGGVVALIDALQSQEWPQAQIPDQALADLTSALLAAFSADAKKRGRKPWPEDQQAYIALQNGSPREVVFLEWQNNLSQRRTIKNPRDSFRHAMRNHDLRATQEAATTEVQAWLVADDA